MRNCFCHGSLLDIYCVWHTLQGLGGGMIPRVCRVVVGKNGKGRWRPVPVSTVLNNKHTVSGQLNTASGQKTHEKGLDLGCGSDVFCTYAWDWARKVKTMKAGPSSHCHAEEKRGDEVSCEPVGAAFCGFIRESIWISSVWKASKDHKHSGLFTEIHIEGKIWYMAQL